MRRRDPGIAEDPQMAVESGLFSGCGCSIVAAVRTVAGVDPRTFADRLLKKNIVLPQPQKETGVFWLTVNSTLNRTGTRELAEAFVEASRP